jgi:hypothetical protein
MHRISETIQFAAVTAVAFLLFRGMEELLGFSEADLLVRSAAFGMSFAVVLVTAMITLEIAERKNSLARRIAGAIRNRSARAWKRTRGTWRRTVEVFVGLSRVLEILTIRGRALSAMNAASFRAIVVTSDGLTQDKSPRDIGEVWRMAMSFGCGVTYIQVSERPSPGIYSFMVMPKTRLSRASEGEDPQTGFLAWLGEAIDPRTSPIRYAEVLFDGDRGSTVLGRHYADGLRDERLAALNIPRG